MPWLLLALQIVLGVVLVVAATGKLLRSDEFVAALRLSGLPDAVVRAATVGVPVVEVALALALLLLDGPALVAAFAATSGVLAVFTLWMVWVRARRLFVRCGCFGASGGEVGPRTIGRNGVLLVLALAGALLALGMATPGPGPSSAWAATVIPLLLAAALLHALWMAWPHLIVTPRKLAAVDGTMVDR